MPQVTTLKCRGLYTFPNSLSELPEGALVEAVNVNVDRDGVVSPRRGFKLYGDAIGVSSTNRSKQLITYKGRILRHYSTTLEFDSNGSGTFTAFTGSYSEVESGLRMKSVEANGNLYFTTSTGIKKISAESASGLSASSITSAGGVKSLDGYAEINYTSGFFLQDSVIAYRVIWGIKDANNNLILGAPSESIVISNPILYLLIKDLNTLYVSLDTASAADGGDALSDTDYAAAIISINSSASSVYTALGALCTKLDADLSVTDFSTISTAHSTAPSDNPTSAELVELQSFYDDIVDALLAQATGKISATAQLAGNFQNSTTSTTVNITFTVPSDATTNHLFQIYRTALVTGSGTDQLADLSPGDECQLIYEANPTSGEIAAKSITVNDITPESFRGANLYTNPNSGEGIAQANEVPPLAKDIATFKNSTFYANTQTKHRKQISLLSATGLSGKTFNIRQSGVTTTYTFTDQVAQEVTVTCVAGNLYATPGVGEYFDIFSADNANQYRVWFNVSSGNTAPAGGSGITLLEVGITAGMTNAQVAAAVQAKLNPLTAFIATVATNVVTVVNEDVGMANAPTEHVADAGFTVAVSVAGSGEDAATRKIGISNAATPAQSVDETARSLVRVVNKQISEVVNAFYLSGPADVPGAILFEDRTLGTTAFDLSVGDTSGSISTKFDPDLPTLSGGPAVNSDNEVKPNRIYYSKSYEPEAVPLVNFIDVGAKDQRILRVVPLRDSLFILKSDGIYRLSGETTANFQVSLFDSSTLLVAPDTATVLNNQIYMVSTQGIATVSDTGVSVISRPIENLILPLTQYAAFTTASFAIGYESDRSYLLWTLTNSSDTVSTQCFRYNTFTSTWTTWDIAKTCAVVNPLIDKLFLGAADTNFIEIERKEFSRLDHADRETSRTIPSNGVDTDILSLGALFGIEAGDVLVQTQYLTINKFNRLLKKLDIDSGVADSDYFSTLAAVEGTDLSDKLSALATKLNADAGVADTNYTATPGASFATTQTEFNTIIDKLNADAGVVFTSYSHSTGTVQYEVTVASVSSSTSQITLTYQVPLIAGPVIHYKKIDSVVVWAPHHFGDPSSTKQVREATILFETSAFTSAVASYSSDLSPGFKAIAFSGDGKGLWGSDTWGRSNWGGDGTSRPFRTYIPTEKQRCRYINCKFEHGAAFEKYAIFGISFTQEPTSSRGYR
jgi:hypothetical protein